MAVPLDIDRKTRRESFECFQAMKQEFVKVAYCQVTLVSNEHDGHIRVCMLASILQPTGQVIKCLPPAGQKNSQTVKSQA